MDDLKRFVAATIIIMIFMFFFMRFFTCSNC